MDIDENHIVELRLLPDFNCDSDYIIEESTYKSNNLHDDNQTLDTMEQQESEDLRDLLYEWNLNHLYSIFQDECINVERAVHMDNSDIKQLANKYNIKVGLQIQLKMHIKAYQLAQANTVPPSPTNITNSKFGNPEAISKTHGSILNNNINNASANMDPPEIDVNSIIQNCAHGQSIMNMFKETNKLNEGTRGIIVEAIIQYMMQQEIRMTIDIAKNISEQIVAIFPTEILVYYYCRSQGRKPQGKVYDKYFNSQRPLKASGLISKRSYSSRSGNINQLNNLQLEPPETNITEHLEAIFTNNCSWAELEHHWQATKNHRLHEIANATSTAEILGKWNQYTKPLGYKLINIDFHHLYPAAGSLIINYSTFASKIIPIFEDKIKDPSSRILLRELQEMGIITESGHCCAIFYLLHSILIPTTTVVEDKNNKKIRTKCSISDSQKSFVILGRTVADCEEELMRRNSFKVPVQPLIMITGTILAPNEFLVYFDGFKYLVNSFLEAIDTCFKIFNVLNLEYPIASHLVWRFIQKHFYNIKTKFDKPNVQVDCLIAGLI